ncbi:tetratricopeptide repeat protein [Amycolatopsis sp. 195334CR]|uniref:ATP-binding protein n=1 Tax=Amycolatopsis sp. 195334CR TaxID=2814588 RepID=UPI001A8D7611|nr:tetratricopeptide repeat protein [Amycolatopsis sp. 195334CR]MBN6039989.1 tetratricopeptide repeat protein [Amycolatopsis sp. 195334CR]
MDHEKSTAPGGVVNAAAGRTDQVLRVGHVAGDVHVHGGPVASVPPPRQLPREGTHFTGRAAELSKLDTLLGNAGSARSSTVLISAIAGAPGIGKTSLAVHWAHRVRDRFPDGQLYVNLRGYDASPPLSADHVLDAFLRALGLPAERIPQDADAKASVYRSFLAERRMLVLLDNAATPDQIRPLLPNEPRCLVVVTSRSRLSGLVARDGAHRISLDLLTPDEANRLLRGIIGQDRIDQEPVAVAELAHRCAYLPLALRIAAERVASRPRNTVAELVHELADERQRLDVLAADDDESTAVRTVFSWSYHALSRDTARMFRQLGLHPGPTISLDAAAALTDSTTNDTRRLLDNLVGGHLLAETEPDRYHFHDLLRDYAAEQAAANEPGQSRDSATGRLYQWYLHTAHAALFAYYPQHPNIPIDPRPASCRPLTFSDRDQAHRWFAAEHANLLALIRHAPAVDQHAVGCQLPQAVDCYLGEHRHLADRIMVHQLGASAAQHLGRQLSEHWAYLSLGEAYQESYQHTRRYDEAVICLEQALKIARKIDHKFGEAAALIDLAHNYNEVGRHAEAAAYSQQSIDINRTIGHRRNEGISLIHLGRALSELGQFDQALAYVRQGMDIASTIGAEGIRALALRTLAKIHHRQGHGEDALNYMMQAADSSRSRQLDHDYAENLNHIGVILNDLGRPQEAREKWQEALDILLDLDPMQAAQIRTQLNTIGFPD